MEALIRIPVRQHDFATHKRLEWQRGQHVEPEAQPRNVDHAVVGGEIVEDIAEGLVAKGEEAGESHGKACEHGDAS